jgi:ketosteroid isomerase-like protein
MNDRTSPEQADDQFFEALTAGDARRVEAVLDERFLIVDVMSGTVADRAALVGALDGRVLEFERVELVERTARHYGETAILVGRTQMAGSFGGAGFSTASRYTHVFVRGADAQWRLASAQGTRISDDGV